MLISHLSRNMMMSAGTCRILFSNASTNKLPNTDGQHSSSNPVVPFAALRAGSRGSQASRSQLATDFCRGW